MNGLLNPVMCQFIIGLGPARLAQLVETGSAEAKVAIRLADNGSIPDTAHFFATCPRPGHD